MQKVGVGALILFGSYAEGYAHPMSDIDVGVVFQDMLPLKNDPVQVYGVIYDELTEKAGENVDIVYLHEVPLSLQFNAVIE